MKKYVCKTCGKKISAGLGIPTAALIRHIGEDHDEVKRKYWDLPISDMIKACYEVER